MSCSILRPGIVAVALLVASCHGPSSRGFVVDSSIEKELRQTHAIDNHAHPQRLMPAGEEDRDFDALPADSIQDPALGAAFQPEGPLFQQAQQALFGSSAPEHTAALQQSKRVRQKQKGDLYPSWVLNQVGTDIMVANRVSMGSSLPQDRFKWVPFVDMFLFPLSNAALKAKDPEHQAFFTSEESLLRRFLSNAQLRRLPPGFDDYLTFVSHTLATWKSQGAVGIKFELAYLRDLSISSPQKESADRIYSIYLQSSEPSADEYKIVQDYVFRFIAREAGELHLPIQIHCFVGAGSYFRDENANPLPLESLFNDPALRRTRFIMLHGCWPFAREAAALIQKPNVYVDFSGLGYFIYPAEAAKAIRYYLEAAPAKVLYGSDASPISNLVGWEETAWAGSKNGGLALGLALTGMMQDDEITPEHAAQIVHMVLRENARNLYGF